MQSQLLNHLMTSLSQHHPAGDTRADAAQHQPIKESRFSAALRFALRFAQH
jgi:hypothetical protein